MDITLDVPAGPTAAASARRCLEGLREHVHQRAFDDLRLLVSELVTNSWRHGGLHAGAPIHVAVQTENDLIHTEVSDDGAGFSPSLDAMTDEAGWGLRLVERMAAQWGVRRKPRTTVWFELPAIPSDTAG